MAEQSKREGKVMHLRIPEDLHARVAEFATSTHRSLNGAAVHLMETALDQNTKDNR